MLPMLLGIELQNLGFSIEELRNSSVFLENSSHPNFMDRFRKLRQRFSVSTAEYSCYVLICGPGSFDDIQHEKITVIHRNAEQDSEEAKFWRQDPGDAVSALECRVEARDSYAARRQAIQIIESILAYWRIYRPSREHIVHPGVLVISKESKIFIGKNKRPEVLLPRDARGADQRAADLFDSITTIQEDHARHLGAALQYFRLSLYARKQEARLINLWIALEALFQDIGQGSLISKATRYVSDIMAINYIQNIARAIPVDIRDVWRNNQPIPFLDLLPSSNDRILHSDDFMILSIVNANCKDSVTYLNPGLSTIPT